MEQRSTAYRNLADDELLNKLRVGNHTAYEEIYRRYWAMLFRHARRILSSDEDARDLIQDLFENLWKRADEITVESSLSAYLYGMVRYKVFDLLDKRKVQQRHLQSIETFISQGAFTTDETVRENELHRIIEKEIALLPTKMREVFELSRKAQLSYQQISTRLDISGETVKKQMYNAHKILRFKLGNIGMLLLFLFR